MGHLTALLAACGEAPIYEDLEWLDRLLRNPEAAVRTAAVETLQQISVNSIRFGRVVRRRL